MTEKLYFRDSHLKEFEALVTDCIPYKDAYRICLDRTAFFPEGGGQNGDTGFLNEIPVTDTQEKDGLIWHDTKEAIAPGTKVTGRLHWEKRFSRMQQHSGEHIVSGLIHARFGYDNVGFHLGEQEVTLDFNGPVSKEELREIELEANRVVWANLPVEISYPDREALKTLEYRSKIEIEGQVRIVSFPGADVCACCAPHVKRTGEIGLIKLTNVQTHRGGVRINLLAGDRALFDYREKEDGIKAVSVLLSAKEALVPEATEHLKQQAYLLTGRLMKLQLSIVESKAKSLPEGTENAIFFEEDLDAGAMREFVNLLTSRILGIACVFSGSDEEGYRYVLGSAREDVRPLCKELNSAFMGKGGGKPQMVQGSLTGTKQALHAAFLQIFPQENFSFS